MKQREIRFCVGNNGNQLSPVWKIWNSKNDVYMSGKFLGGAFKISLHSSGVWTVAATTESGIELNPGNRRMKTWQRPPEFKKGWTWGPQIAVPRIGAVDSLVIDEKQTKKVEWIPVPIKNMKVTIGVVFATHELSLKERGQICGKDDNYLDSYLELENTQKVFMHIRYEKISEIDQTHIKYLNSEARQLIEINKSDVKGFISILMQGSDVPYVYTLKFGRHPQLTQ